ncbi:MAG: ketopantoate reductase family protein [Ilumatobacteraceae bacterium]|nr:ketopantoate reductase family protein [Ilumatobacteraceae bacterium]
MRYIIYGAGGIGGVVGGRLAQGGHDVALIARGAHAAAMREHGLRLASPIGSDVLHLPVFEHPREIRFTDDDVVLMAVKGQDTGAALDALALEAGPELPIVCLQNGVANEAAALRRFRDVYAVPVLCPTGHLEPGVVVVYSAPNSGIFDIGRYPGGVDERCTTIAAAFTDSTFVSIVRPDVMRWKWAKLLANLANSVEAACGPITGESRLVPILRAEGEAALHAAGIDFASFAEDKERRGDLLSIRPVDGERRGGGSSWQSLARGVGSIESDFLNGEIVLLGRLHGVPTPLNEVLQRLANRMAATQTPPGTMTEDDVLALLGPTA